MKKKNIAIIGLGLMGGSLAIQLRKKGIANNIIGVESNADSREIAINKNLVNDCMTLEDAVRSSEVIILTTQVETIKLLLPKILNLVENQIVIDFGSTKHEIINSVKNHCKRNRYVAAHPMWGTENSGILSVEETAYGGRVAVICNKEESDVDAVEWVYRMFSDIGMNTIDMNDKMHDMHVAYISHISHITSFALANTVLEKDKDETAIFQLASGGFESTVRLAKSSPEMWLQVFLQNKDNILTVLNEHLNQLNRFKESIEKNDTHGLRNLMENANKIKKILK